VSWVEAAGLVALGAFAGCYGTMVGLGGGFLLMPALLLMHFDPRSAAGTTMAVVLANSASGAFSYSRQRRVDFRTGFIFAAAGAPGAWLGASLDQIIPQRLFSVLLAALLAWVAVRLSTTDSTQHMEIEDEALHDDEPRPGLLSSEQQGFMLRDFVDAQGVRHVYRYNLVAGIALAAAAGFTASVFGLGGGIIYVPAMVSVFGFPTHVATATSHFIIALTALFGTASHALYGDVRWLFALCLSAGAVCGAVIGAKLAKRVRPAPLMRLLAVAIVVCAAKLVWDALT
jgi:uncharacterized protein